MCARPVSSTKARHATTMCSTSAFAVRASATRRWSSALRCSDLAQKIVFNAHYLMYFDTAIAGYWRALALPYAESMEHLGGDLYVRKASVEYEGSARYDDVLDVGIRCARIGNSSLVFGAAVF